eukprot:5608_1
MPILISLNNFIYEINNNIIQLVQLMKIVMIVCVVISQNIIKNNYKINIFNNIFIDNRIQNSISDNYHGGGSISWLLNDHSTSIVNVYIFVILLAITEVKVKDVQYG